MKKLTQQELSQYKIWDRINKKIVGTNRNFELVWIDYPLRLY